MNFKLILHLTFYWCLKVSYLFTTIIVFVKGISHHRLPTSPTQILSFPSFHKLFRSHLLIKFLKTTFVLVFYLVTSLPFYSSCDPKILPSL